MNNIKTYEEYNYKSEDFNNEKEIFHQLNLEIGDKIKIKNSSLTLNVVDIDYEQYFYLVKIKNEPMYSENKIMPSEVIEKL